MTPPLFVVDVLPEGDEFVLDGDEGRHAARVNGLNPGERVSVADGAGARLDCVVRAVHGDSLVLTVDARTYEPEPDPRLVVVQALPKGDRADLAVETMTELGVDVIVPWAAARSIAQWHGPRGDKALARWRRTAREASKQSRRARTPLIEPLASTTDVAARLRTATGFVLHEDATEPIAAAALPANGEIVVVVGPEGGIAPDELESFSDAGAQLVRLGAPVLRTSTAGPAALAALSLRLGRWS